MLIEYQHGFLELHNCVKYKINEMEVKENVYGLVSVNGYLAASYYNILYTYKWPNGLGNASKVLVWQVL